MRFPRAGMARVTSGWEGRGSGPRIQRGIFPLAHLTCSPCGCARMADREKPMRRTFVLPTLAIVVSGLMVQSAAAAWRPSAFVIGGYAVGGDPLSLIRLNDAGVEI